jgi:CxxC motif-containing protein (DUF1111 family)
MKLERSRFVYPDGTTAELSKPVYRVDNPYDMQADAGGAKSSRLLASDVRFSPRMGMPMFGLGLLEAIPESDILRLAKADHGEEGVHGKPNFVFDRLKAKKADPYPVSLGRFGLKASTPSVAQQSLGALNGDIGVTNWLFPVESIASTRLFDDFVVRTGWSQKIEADDATAESLVFYSRTLAVPPRRAADEPDVIQGGRRFSEIRCVSCHVPSFTTGPSDIKSLAGQKIFPFTDLLLHDMGEGLADHRRDFDADGRQWKTRPLWGIGLTQVVNPRAGFLHDGRARSLEEAILWHDGEARFSRDRFAALSLSERRQVIAFLKSL